MSQAIEQTVVFKNVTPARLYEVLLSSSEHAAFTGAAADVSSEEGGRFSAHDGKIEGRNVELIAGERIVQAWRPANWPAGQFSMVRLDLQAQGSDAQLTLTHTGFPEGAGEHLGGGWQKMYWEPLAKYLG